MLKKLALVLTIGLTVSSVAPAAPAASFKCSDDVSGTLAALSSHNVLSEVRGGGSGMAAQEGKKEFDPAGFRVLGVTPLAVTLESSASNVPADLIFTLAGETVAPYSAAFLASEPKGARCSGSVCERVLPNSYERPVGKLAKTFLGNAPFSSKIVYRCEYRS